MRLARLVLTALAPLAACAPAFVTEPPIVTAPPIVPEPAVVPAPSVASSVKIRGATSASASQPLFIVDGKVVTLGSLNQSDIETIEIVKGPAAASLYGENKCPPIVIRTKRATTAAPVKR